MYSVLWPLSIIWEKKDVINKRVSISKWFKIKRLWRSNNCSSIIYFLMYYFSWITVLVIFNPNLQKSLVSKRILQHAPLLSKKSRTDLMAFHIIRRGYVWFSDPRDNFSWKSRLTKPKTFFTIGLGLIIPKINCFKIMVKIAVSIGIIFLRMSMIKAFE